MSWILGILAGLVVFIALYLVGTWLSADRTTLPIGKALRLGSFAVIALWIIFDSAIAAFHQVPAGYIGVVYEFGAIKGQIREGVNVLQPWRTVILANVQIQRHVFDKLEAFSQETQDVFVKATLNIRVSPDAIQGLYRDVGPNYFDVLVLPRVAQNFKDELVKYKSVYIAPHREQLRTTVRERLKQELQKYSIEVDDLLLENIDFSSQFKAAIESKQIATQKALEEEQRVSVVKRQAEQAVEKATGEGKSILIVAESQAKANKLVAESLTPTLVQYTLAQKLGDQIKVILLPAGQQFILCQDILATR